MCDDVSVNYWLEGLRCRIEYYEPYDDKIFGLNHVPDMESSDENHQEEVYVNLWDCQQERNESSKRFEIKFAEVCRLSAVFLDEVEELEDSQDYPRSVVKSDSDLPVYVMLWKNQIRENYCEEPQTILETQVSARARTGRSHLNFKMFY